MESLSWLQLLISGGLPVVAIFVQGMLLSRQRVSEDKTERSKLIWAYELEKLKQFEHDFSVILDFAGLYQNSLTELPIRYGRDVEAAISKLRLMQLSFSEYKDLREDIFVFLERYTLLVNGDETVDEKRQRFDETITVGSEVITNCRRVLLGEKIKRLSVKVIDRNRAIELSAYYDEQDKLASKLEE